MKQVFIKQGNVIIEEVPAPLISEGEILVQVYYSCISAGTELANIRASEKSLIRKAMEKPQDIKKILENLKVSGLKNTIVKVKRKIESSNPIGYSAAGIILEVGKNIKNFKPGDRVACAGAGIANHAEFIAIPENLTARIPERLSYKDASTVTLGCIALQGVRRCDTKLGEIVTVIGLGILGQVTVQLLKAAGCRVVGIDLEEERINKAISAGMDYGIAANTEGLVGDIIRYTGGFGSDAVIITASSDSPKVINDAMKICRKKGKVIIVGAVKMDIEREEFYKKEIDLLISTSYGPGRYDENYEKRGCDYPFAYIRWTENRNMIEYLNQVESGRINLDILIDRVYKIDEASQAYEEFKSGKSKPLIVLLEYNKEAKPVSRKKISEIIKHNGIINVAIIGAGGFVTGVHLPNISKLGDIYKIAAISDKSGSVADAVTKEYGAVLAASDYKDILSEKNIDMVVITTRHNLHASIARDAVEAGKAVFVEKPMALNKEELQQLAQILKEKNTPFIVGFNRRFSPFAAKIKEITENRLNPMIINYRMNAGFIPGESWVHKEEGGGRNIGEACHIYDLFNYFTGGKPKEIFAASIDPGTEQYNSNDNFVATVKYSDGSVCNLVYTALGSPNVPKEQMEIYFDNKIIFMNDYLELKIYGLKEQGQVLKSPDKGHFKIMQLFGESIKNGQALIPLWQLVQATEISFEVEKQIKEC